MAMFLYTIVSVVFSNVKQKCSQYGVSTKLLYFIGINICSVHRPFSHNVLSIPFLVSLLKSSVIYRIKSSVIYRIKSSVIYRIKSSVIYRIPIVVP